MEGECAEDAFIRHMEQNDALNTHSEMLQRMLKAKQNVEKINEARQAEQEIVTEPEPMKEDDGPQIGGEPTYVMNDVANLQENDKSGSSWDTLLPSLNADHARIFECMRRHFEYQVQHENDTCKSDDFNRLSIFASGAGGTGKSYLIKTIHALVSKIWNDNNKSLLCAVTAPTGLAAFNVVGVTIHRLLQLPIEHEGKTAGYY